MYCEKYYKGFWVNVKLHTTFLDRHQDERYTDQAKIRREGGGSFSHAPKEKKKKKRRRGEGKKACLGSTKS